MKLVNLIGQQLGRWTVIARAENTRQGQARWLCRCECGKEKIVKAQILKLGLSRSCGCLKDEEVIKRSTKHGHATNGVSPTYHSWAGMIARCTKIGHKDYARYGGRGIKVYQKWRQFSGFLADMGEKPKGHSIDRFPDMNGNYEPGNCRWATSKQQARNKSNNTILEFNGERHTIGGWAERLNVPASTLSYRLNHNWTIPDILSQTIKRFVKDH